MPRQTRPAVLAQRLDPSSLSGLLGLSGRARPSPRRHQFNLSHGQWQLDALGLDSPGLSDLLDRLASRISADVGI